MSVLMSSPKTQAFPCKIAVVVTGEGTVPGGGDGINGEECDEEDSAGVDLLFMSEKPPWINYFSFNCRCSNSSRRC
jgi:hypothetical protein